MDLVSHFRKMARNNAWSNHRLYTACARLDDGEFEATRASFFPSLHDTLNHILAIDHYYIDTVTQGGRGPAAFFEYKPVADVKQLAAAQADSDRRLIAFCDSLGPADSARRVTTDRGEAGKFDETIGDLLAHLFLHQIHHRGQAHAMLSGTTVKPPQLDEYFLDFDAAARSPDLIAAGIDGPEAIR
ncbi:MAG: damage-inducible protein DinB [Sphingomonadales bacterium]|nr:damage-inducible protein DinB [Sphingomonadales bacterium]